MKNKLFMMLAVAFISTAVVFSGCKKTAPAPPPAAYVPGFSATAVPYNAGGIDYLSFMVSCTTDDIEIIKVTIAGPGGSVNDTFTGNGSIIIKNEPMTFSNDYVKLLGTWSFTFTGNIKSGTHSGDGFTGSASVNVTGK